LLKLATSVSVRHVAMHSFESDAKNIVHHDALRRFVHSGIDFTTERLSTNGGDVLMRSNSERGMVRT
jgi:hypothetical protein